MTKEEIEVVKNFIAEIDYHLNNRDKRKANRIMNDMCIYLLKKEGYSTETNNAAHVDVLFGFNKKLVKFGRDELAVTIPHTRYEHTKKLYLTDESEEDLIDIFNVSSKRTNQGIRES